MIIVSLGFTCYIKSLINLTKYRRKYDIFDWMNSFEFKEVVKSIEDGFDIFSHIIPSPLNIDINNRSVFYNGKYSFRLPHERNIDESKITYKRRFERFLAYRDTAENYLFIRLINGGRYNTDTETIEDHYNEYYFEKLMTYLPSKSKILLLTDRKMTDESLNKVYHKFYIVDDCINPDHVFFGPYSKHKNKIVECYKSCFDYIDRNFDTFDAKHIHNLIKNEHIGIDLGSTAE